MNHNTATYLCLSIHTTIDNIVTCLDGVGLDGSISILLPLFRTNKQLIPLPYRFDH